MRNSECNRVEKDPNRCILRSQLEQVSSATQNSTNKFCCCSWDSRVDFLYEIYIYIYIYFYSMAHFNLKKEQFVAMLGIDIFIVNLWNCFNLVLCWIWVYNFQNCDDKPKLSYSIWVSLTQFSFLIILKCAIKQCFGAWVR